MTRHRALLGAVVAAGLVAVLVVLLRTQLEPVPEPERAIPEPSVYALDFADLRHGYALRERCDADTRCVNELLVTEDGAHWQTRQLPTADRPPAGDRSGLLFVLGPDRVALGDFADPAGPGRAAAKWYSADSGRTWRQVPEPAEEGVEAIPAGGVLQAQCVGIGESCVRSRLVVMLPDSGRNVVLANQPALKLMRVGPAPSADGGWWVLGLLPDKAGTGVAVSRDAGLSWSVAELPNVVYNPAPVDMDARAGTAYVAMATGPARGLATLVAICRSTDGGRSWAVIWLRSGGDAEPDTLDGVPIAAADGSLEVHTTSGRSFRTTGYGPTRIRFYLEGTSSGQVRRTGAGYLSHSATRPNAYALSADGLTWTTILVG
jgi:hypothetical protein